MSALAVRATLGAVASAYRRCAARLIPLAVVVFAPVVAVDAWARGMDDPWPAGVVAAVAAQLLGIYLLEGAAVDPVSRARAGGSQPGLRKLLAPLSSAGRLAGVALLAGVPTTLGLLTIVPGLWLAVVWAVAAPAVVAEGARPPAALRRSRELVRGHGWRVLVVILAVLAVQFAVTLLLAGGLAVAPTPAGAAIAQLVGFALVAPLTAVAAATLYFELLAD